VLKDGRALSGRLVGADEHLNLVLDDAQETTENATRRLGRIVLRGSSVVTLNAAAPAPSRPSE
ncbi:MAG: LSM domain-containing protein, partial [Thermoplasmata archaeon]|nr:LSM domain-containing protein [Thermoplasmata archaeon]